ncbi:MAG: T9SS type A sorting domain-containing protein [Saprospiraceae bacterium]|nr:T9SS type A sorting domain-containing protein [Saprospiraceae bacterium]
MKSKVFIFLFGMCLYYNSMIAQSCIPTWIVFSTQQDIDNFHLNYPSCTEIEGDVIIKSSPVNSINNLNGLSQLVSVGGLNIDYNTSLNTLSGLENITRIKGNLLIWDNTSLNSIQALGNLQNVDGFVYIAYNNVLPDLNGLDNLDSIAGHLEISYNPNMSSIDALQNLNPLTIESTFPSTIDLQIYSNPKLSICHLDNICQFLNLSDRTTNIINNKTGCESVEIVRSFCPPPPLCTSLTFPLDSSDNVNIQTQLSWSPVSDATGYKISIGTSSGETDILDSHDVGNTNSIDSLNLPCGSFIYVSIIPYNDYGDAFNCSEQLFSTEFTYAEIEDDIELCFLDTVQLTAENSLGLDFQWSPVTGLENSTITNPLASPFNTTLYILSVSNNGRCIETDSILVTVHPLPKSTMSFINETGNNFSNGYASVLVDNGTEPYSILWSNNETTEVIDSLSPGIYTVTITDINGCATTDTVTIDKYVCPTIITNSQFTNPTCFDYCNGSIQLTPIGGMEPYSYSWNNGDSLQNINDLCIGQYIIQITDSLNCTIGDTIALTQPTKIEVSLDSLNNVSCYASCDGYILVSTHGGTGTHSYFWNNNPSSPSINNLCANSYNLIVVDENSCTTLDSFVITQPSVITIVLDSISDITSSSSGYIFTTIADPDNHTFIWNGPEGFESNDQDIENLYVGGLYELTIINNNSNCSIDTSFFISDVSSILDINQLEVKIYPNPTRDYLIIDFQNTEQLRGIIQVHDLLGNIVIREVKRKIDKELNLNLSGLNSGVYIVNIELERGSILYRKFIIGDFNH